MRVWLVLFVVDNSPPFVELILNKRLLRLGIELKNRFYLLARRGIAGWLCGGLLPVVLSGFDSVYGWLAGGTIMEV